VVLVALLNICTGCMWDSLGRNRVFEQVKKLQWGVTRDFSKFVLIPE
jgi:hypothetical protein